MTNLRVGRAAPSPAADRFAAGARSAADAVAPAAIVESARDVSVDATANRIVALTDYPRHVTPHWIGRLIDFDEPCDLAMHLDPLDSAEVVRMLTHRLVEIQSSRMLDAKGGRIASVEREVAYEDVARLRDALERGDERVLSTACYLRVQGRTAAAAEQREARLRGVLAGMMAGVRPAMYEMLPGLLSCLPAGEDHLRRRRNLDTSSAATMFPFGSSHLGMRDGVLLGEDLHNHSLVITDRFHPDQQNANRVVVAASGAGKSYASKVEALRAMVRGVDYLVIDPEEEYGRLCEAVGGQMVRLAGTSQQRINPFDLAPGNDESGRDPLAERVLALQGLLGVMLADPGRTLDQRERGLLDAALYETYRRVGITRDAGTHHRQPPVMRDLLAVLREADDLGLADRLVRYVDGSLGRVFAEHTTVSLDRPLVVFALRDLEEELRPVAMHLVADYVWREVTRTPRPRVLLVDEAWTLMRHADGARFLASIARRARKRWLGLTTVTQDARDFLQSPEGHTILANSASQFLLRQDSSTIAVVAETFNLSRGERDFLLSARRGEALLLTGGNHVALRVVASELEHGLSTTQPAEVAAQRAVAR
ncbi:MAG: ATP-binding protein [Dehalococcoidia bacterium]|nr:ATP-binding protein [Dehalococcoidia bacterium]